MKEFEKLMMALYKNNYNLQLLYPCPATGPKRKYHLPIVVAKQPQNRPKSQSHVTTDDPSVRKQASSSLLLAFASMVILGVEPHRDRRSVKKRLDFI
jgi:hypothetical protein